MGNDVSKEICEDSKEQRKMVKAMKQGVNNAEAMRLQLIKVHGGHSQIEPEAKHLDQKFKHMIKASAVFVTYQIVSVITFVFVSKYFKSEEGS